MKVLVTGHHGYIGSILVPALAARGHEVTGLDTFFYRGCDLEPDPVTVPALDLDVRDVVPRHFERYDAVVHLAALSNDPLGDLSSRWTVEINFEGTMAVARAAKKAGVRRFVFASSCSMYGASNGETSVGEEAPLRPLSAYAESKVRCEEGLQRLADDSFSPTFMRNATAYGASPRLRLDVVLNNLMGWGFTTNMVRLMSDGTPWRPLVHVQDIAECTIRVLEAPLERVHNQAFNVGSSDQNYQVRELAEIVREILPTCSIEYAAGAGPDPRSYRVDFGKLAGTFPDLTLRWDARAGARELLEAYRRAALTFADFDGRRFTRLKHLKLLVEAEALDRDLRWNHD